MQRRSDLAVFYGLLDELEVRIGERRRLGDCHGRMSWPERGVYFFSSLAKAVTQTLLRSASSV